MTLIYTLVARLTKVQVKTIDDTVITMETENLAESLSDPLMKMKSRR